MDIIDDIKEITSESSLLCMLILLGFVVYFSSIFFNANISVSDWIYFITLLALIWYADETRKIREIEQAPILLLYVRKRKQDELNEYCIETGASKMGERFDKYGGDNTLKLEEHFCEYMIKIRNVGKSPAFNVTVDNKDFKVKEYQSQFIAPEKDEQSIKIVKRDEKEIKSDYSEFKDSVFVVSCKNINGKKYNFNYKIIDLEKRLVEYLK
jgi:hypothetical protein